MLCILHGFFVSSIVIRGIHPDVINAFRKLSPNSLSQHVVFAFFLDSVQQGIDGRTLCCVERELRGFEAFARLKRLFFSGVHPNCDFCGTHLVVLHCLNSPQWKVMQGKTSIGRLWRQARQRLLPEGVYKRVLFQVVAVMPPLPSKSRVPETTTRSLPAMMFLTAAC